jgi:hypothetical protein
MPDLAQIVGGLLRDLAKARFGSDLYARDVARYYEQDGLLRRFPVPRPEVTEVEIDLKFLVGTVDLEPTQHELTEATLATVYEPYAAGITTAVIDALGHEISETIRKADFHVPSAIEAKAGRTWVQINVRKAVLKTLLDAWGRIAEPRGPTDVRELATHVREKVRKGLAGDLELGESEREDEEKRARQRKDAGDTRTSRTADELVESTLEASSSQIEGLIGRLADELAKASAGRGDCRVNVEVGHGTLSQAPGTAISTIRVKASVRNYVWTQIATEKGEQHWYALNPE